jgi:NitT/TauT family transport system ATP-binding protein
VLEVSHVTKRFTTAAGTITALDNISFSVGEGEFVSLVGPSGCGKSTLTNIVAGLIAADSGVVRLHGEPIRGVSRRVGYTFQQTSLLPWRTVLDNVALGLELRGTAPALIRERADAALAQVGLAQFAGAFPHQLSGGMSKRAEIARVLAIDPELLLMDEPFGALDAQTRATMQNHLLHLLQTMRKTVLFITHDLEEAVLLSDRVVTLSARPGRIRDQHRITLRRPRDARTARLDPDFAPHLKAVWDDIEPSAEIA